MSENIEVQKYVLDIADVEAKTRRLVELHGQVAAAEKAGHDSGELRSQLASEAEALTHVGRTAGETGNAVEKLVKNKRALNEVAHLMGAEFGALIPELGGAAHLFASLGAVAGPIAGTFAAIGAAMYIFEQRAESIRRAREELEALHEAGRKFMESQKGGAEAGGETLQKFGALTPENERASAGLSIDAMRLGTPIADARKLAPFAAISGKLSAKDIQLLAAAGLTPESPEAAEQMVAALKSNPDLLAQTEAAARGVAGSHAGRAAVTEAAIFDEVQKRMPRFGEQLEGGSQDDLLLDAAKRYGVKGVKSIEDIDRIRQRGQKLRKKKQQGEEAAKALEGMPTEGFSIPEDYSLSREEEAALQKADLLDAISGRMNDSGVSDTTGPVRGGAEEAAGAGNARGFSEGARQGITVINQIYNHSIGTQYHNGANPNDPFKTWGNLGNPGEGALAPGP